MRKINRIGQVFGRLQVISGVERAAGSPVYWRCLCACGNLLDVAASNLVAGRTKSCGCLAREKAQDLHRYQVKSPAPAHYATKTYRSWDNMLQRCYNQNHIGYLRYGGRGVVVCDRWRTNYWNFLADLGEAPHGHSLDRKDNSGNYTPENCRWASAKEQSLNRRSNVLVAHEGKCQPLGTWADELGLPYKKLYNQVVTRQLNLAEAIQKVQKLLASAANPITGKE